MPKNVISLSDVERAVMTMAHVAFENEKYFGDLDGEMGDADFGKSLATGFHAIQAEFDKIDHSDIGVLLTKCGMIFAANVGGCSGPLWGTAFMRAGMVKRDAAAHRCLRQMQWSTSCSMPLPMTFLSRKPMKSA